MVLQKEPWEIQNVSRKNPELIQGSNITDTFLFEIGQRQD